MTVMPLRDAIDGAKYVSYAGDGRPVFVAWHGGTTFNVYAEVDGGVQETTCFNVSDEKGRPLDQDQAETKADEWLASHGIHA